MRRIGLKTRWWVGLAVLAGLAVLVAPTVLATGSVTSQLQLRINATGSASTGLGTVTDPITLDWTQLFSSGTGANQASNLYHARRTINASSSEELDLAGTLTNSFGTTLTFTKIKAFAIRAAAANTNNVQVGGAASNAWVGWVGDASDIVSIKPGGVLLWIAPDASGAAVSAGDGDLLKIANSGGSTSVTYDVVVLGID